MERSVRETPGDPLFLTPAEREAVRRKLDEGDLMVGRFYAALRARARRRSGTPGLLGMHEDAAWWYPAFEYLSEGAMAYALAPDEALGVWLRDTALAVARRPVSDWVGPWFRDHVTRPPVGHLETAHLCWALAATLDLAREAFTDGAAGEVRQALTDKGMLLCRRWLERNTHLANWRSIMASGVTVAAAVLGDRDALEQGAAETQICAQAFQPDGSYAESLQYGNYLAFALMLAYEAAHRSDTGVRAAGPEVQARAIPWMASSLFYMKPLSGWGATPRARSANFNDSGATFRPSGDVLLQVAARCRGTAEAGVARWLFDTVYGPVPDQEPGNLASFGLRTNWGFLTVPFLAGAAAPTAPAEAGLPELALFSNGNVIVRSGWEAPSILAIQGGSEDLYGPGHLHGDINHFILVHNRERLVVDPGHSCYRNLIHGLESSTQTHNTCTFLAYQDELGLQEDLAKAKQIEQSSLAGRRRIEGGRVSSPVRPRGRRLLMEGSGEAAAVGSEAGGLYGDPIREFSRFWIRGGEHVLFVIDRIRASEPVTTIWNWLLNNRDGESEFEVGLPDRVTLRRHAAGLILSHHAGGRLHGPIYAYVHDAYHPEPDRLGEGRPGSGMLYRWMERAPALYRTAVHTFVVDDYGRIDGWRVEADAGSYAASRPGQRWTLTLRSEEPLEAALTGGSESAGWTLRESEDTYTFKRDR